MDPLLQIVYDFGDKAHGEQLRKYSEDRYMMHCKRVMEICQSYTQDYSVLIAALLHDVLEDTSVTKDQLQKFLGGIMTIRVAQKALQLIIELTDVFIKSDYPNWNRKKRRRAEANRISTTSAESQTIKYADIIDNCRDIATNDPLFAKVFLNECASLLSVMNKGNSELKYKATEAVLKALEILENKKHREE